jgi:hypothetical protein
MAKRTPVSVRLEWFEISAAAQVGVSRNVEAIRAGYRSRMRGKDSMWDRHVLGALGECAFAKATGRYWSGSVNTFKSGGDVGNTIQIRTRSKHDYDLIVRDDDRDDDIYVLVTGGPQEFLVHGWMLCADAKSKQFVSDYGGYGEAYFVPQSELRPVEELFLGDGK